MLPSGLGKPSPSERPTATRSASRSDGATSVVKRSHSPGLKTRGCVVSGGDREADPLPVPGLVAQRDHDQRPDLPGPFDPQAAAGLPVFGRRTGRSSSNRPLSRNRSPSSAQLPDRQDGLPLGVIRRSLAALTLTATPTFLPRCFWSFWLKPRPPRSCRWWFRVLTAKVREAGVWSVFRPGQWPGPRR